MILTDEFNIDWNFFIVFSAAGGPFLRPHLPYQFSPSLV